MHNNGGKPLRWPGGSTQHALYACIVYVCMYVVYVYKESCQCPQDHRCDCTCPCTFVCRQLINQRIPKGALGRHWTDLRAGWRSSWTKLRSSECFGHGDLHQPMTRRLVQRRPLWYQHVAMSLYDMNQIDVFLGKSHTKICSICNPYDSYVRIYAAIYSFRSEPNCSFGNINWPSDIHRRTLHLGQVGLEYPTVVEVKCKEMTHGDVLYPIFAHIESTVMTVSYTRVFASIVQCFHAPQWTNSHHLLCPHQPPHLPKPYLCLSQNDLRAPLPTNESLSSESGLQGFNSTGTNYTNIVTILYKGHSE